MQFDILVHAFFFCYVGGGGGLVIIAKWKIWIDAEIKNQIKGSYKLK